MAKQTESGLTIDPAFEKFRKEFEGFAAGLPGKVEFVRPAKGADYCWISWSPEAGRTYHERITMNPLLEETPELEDTLRQVRYTFGYNAERHAQGLS